MLGILVMAGEFRHNTATSTFLVSPDRSQVVRAKLIAASIVGVLLALAASALTLAIALPWLASKDIDVDVLSGDVGPVLLGGIAATALYALVGVGSARWCATRRQPSSAPWCGCWSWKACS